MEAARAVSEDCEVSGPDKHQAPQDKALKEVSLSSGSGALENGVRVSVTTPEVETEVSIKRIFGEGNEDVSYSDKEDVEERAKQGSGFVLGVDRNEENVDERITPKDGSFALGADASIGKVGCHDNGISLAVEVQLSSPPKIDLKRDQKLAKKGGHGENDGLLKENEGNPSDKIKEMDGSNHELMRYKNGELDEAVGDGGYEYSVGDFVWGKIKSHPWWPGLIYDPKDASKHTAKYSHKDRLLVAYFGDDTFAWCSPSQMKPFVDNFMEMSKQSNSRSFVKAVEEAVFEIGRRLEFEMTCSCTPKEIRIELSRSLTLNAGIKEEAAVPGLGIGNSSLAYFEPENFLSDLKCFAQVVSATNILELAVLKSHLSAFCRSKNPYHQLAVNHEPLEIAGLEDKVGNGVTKISELGGSVEVPIQGPVEDDWLSVSPSSMKTSQNLLHKVSGSEDKLYQRRKQKSMAEIMRGNDEVEPKNEETEIGKVDINSVKLATSSTKKSRKKVGPEFESHAVDSNSAPAGRRKKSKLYESLLTLENRAVSFDSDGSEGKEDSGNSSGSRDKKKKSPIVEDDGGRLPEEGEQTSVSRERKKSKYLCPPYTNVIRMPKTPGSIIDLRTELVEVSSVAVKGERSSKTAGQSVGSPKGSSEATFQNKDSKEQTPKQNRNKVIDLKDMSISFLQEVLSVIRLAALNPVYLRENKSFSKIEGFLSTFRSTIYHEGSNYCMFSKHGPGRKRKHLESESASTGEDLRQNEHDSPKQVRKSRKKTTETDGQELKQATAERSDMKAKHKEKNKEVGPATLFLSFGPGISLPSKDELVKIFSKFGRLNESETEILYDSFCAQVVFSRSSDAEEAFNCSQKASPFGAARVTYRLRYPPSGPPKGIPDKKHQPPNKKAGKAAAADPSDGGEKSQLNFIKQKLEMMTCMLEKSSGKMSGDMKSNLEDEMKGLLEKVSTMAETSSS